MTPADLTTQQEPNMTTFELVFWGGAINKLPRHKRNHDTIDSAEAEARRILAKIGNRPAHPAIIYGPGCGKDGRTIS
jgi:hypothetical protein